MDEELDFPSFQALQASWDPDGTIDPDTNAMRLRAIQQLRDRNLQQTLSEDERRALEALLSPQGLLAALEDDQLFRLVSGLIQKISGDRECVHSVVDTTETSEHIRVTMRSALHEQCFGIADDVRKGSIVAAQRLSDLRTQLEEFFEQFYPAFQQIMSLRLELRRLLRPPESDA